MNQVERPGIPRKAARSIVRSPQDRILVQALARRVPYADLTFAPMKCG